MIVGVVGAGAMGRGIAQVAAVAGHDVLLFDVDPDAVDAARSAVSDSLARAVERGRVAADVASAATSRLAGAASLDAFAGCDLVIEAVVERIDVKRDVFARLEAVVGDETILASNTSSLSIASVASGLARPERVLGLHFFNPVPAMRLVEIVAGPHTDPGVVDRVRSWVEGIGKVGVVVRDSPGFLVNLAGRAYVTEALAILRDGIATVAQVDRIATENLGFPLGPFQLMDLTGIDVNYPVTENLFEHNFGDPQLRSTWYHRYLLDAGLLGRKTGRGFYDYDDATRSSVDTDTETDDDATPAPASVTVAVAGDRAGDLARIVDQAGVTRAEVDAADLVLVAPLGADASSTAVRLGLDPTRVVALDLLLPDAPVRTLMVPPGVSESAVSALAGALRAGGEVEVIRDSPGFIGQRLLAAVVNLATQIAQRGIARPEDIDTAVTLGLRYPKGPLAWADEIGLDVVVDVLRGMYDTDGDPRYNPSPWLRRRAVAGLSALTPDHTV